MGRATIIRWADKPAIDWEGQTAIIVASGPTARSTNFELLRGQRVIAVNRSWELVPEFADVVFGMDGVFWHHHKGLPQFAGRKVTCSPMAAQSFGLDCLFCPGNNSGVRAIYLAEAFNVRRVLLIGFDMHANAGVHWHEPHPKPARNPGEPEMRQWRAEMEKVAAAVEKRGLEILNCTPQSALECFAVGKLDVELQRGTNTSRRPAVAGGVGAV